MMRGGAQAHLLEASDGHSYVVKFLNNPQHRRILVNEWLSTVFLRHLRVPTPAATRVQITADFLSANPDVSLQVGSRRISVEPGWHFGSRFPGNPSQDAVYDFLPDTLLRRVINIRDFIGAYVFDKWMANTDMRQTIFYRTRLEAYGQPHNSGFIAVMVDHGYVFDGATWTFIDSPYHGRYCRPLVYEHLRSLSDYQPWLDRVLHFPELVIRHACSKVPPAWLDEDYPALDQVIEQLLRRRSKISELVAQGLTARV